MTFTRNDVQRITISALGALMISTACVGAAVFPAKAAEITTSTASDWQVEVEKRLDAALRSPIAHSPKVVMTEVVMTEVVMTFDADGSFHAAKLAKSSGIDAVDREAIRVANTIRYPALPTYLQGKPQNVAMQIFFGNSTPRVREQNAKARETATALAAKQDATREQAQIAAQPTG